MIASSPIANPQADGLPALLKRFDTSGPRYTSYPTADRFVEAFDEKALRNWLCKRQIGALAAPLSAYIHLPFCASVCYYCACNKIVTRDQTKSAEYLRYLAREIDLYAEALGSRPTLTQLHLGGGTPTFLTDAELDSLMTMLKQAFALDPRGEYSIEVDPRTVDGERLRLLVALGFNRMSFGVQDFDEQVQRAVHRVQSTEQVADLMHAARALGVGSLNLDLIYGLPRQTPESFGRTLDTVCRLRPDRVALYAYAHLPERFKPQRRIVAAELPTAGEKVAMLQSAIAKFTEAGYVYIGMDHFALPEDPLAVAKRQGRLHRSFQGYTTQAESDLIALGVSAIGKIGPTYSQNVKTLPEYYDLLNQGRLPVLRGIELTRDDLLRRTVIMSLMCQGRVSMASIELAYLVQFGHYFARELERLRPLQEDGLVEIGEEWIQVTDLGWYFVRAIAMVFDRYLRPDADAAASRTTRFSKIL